MTAANNTAPAALPSVARDPHRLVAVFEGRCERSRHMYEANIYAHPLGFRVVVRGRNHAIANNEMILSTPETAGGYARDYLTRVCCTSRPRRVLLGR